MEEKQEDKRMELSSEMNQLIEDLTPTFDDDLQRAFRNDGLRLHRLPNKRRFIYPLDDVLISLDDSKIELFNLKLPWVPDFRINQLTSNLRMFCLDIDLNLGSLIVDGEYEANNSALQKLLPVSHNGKIKIAFNKVKAQGKIGLIIKQDSFVTENYDIKYEPSEVVVRVNYFKDNENEVENEISYTDLDNTIGKTVWNQLTEILTNLLRNQLGEVVVEFSVTELLSDQDEELRQYGKEQTTKANRLLDSLLCSAKDYLVAENFRSIQIPSFNVSYKGKLSGRQQQQGQLLTSPGYIKDLSTLTRLKELSLFEDKQTIFVYGSISLGEFKYGYGSYNSKFNDIEINGGINSSIYRNQIFVRISVRKEGERCKPELDSVQVRAIRDIDVDISGLASLTWLEPKVKSWVIGNLRYNALGVLEKHIKEAFEHAITNVDCVALLVD